MENTELSVMNPCYAGPWSRCAPLSGGHRVPVVLDSSMPLATSRGFLLLVLQRLTPLFVLSRLSTSDILGSREPHGEACYKSDAVDNQREV